MEKKKGGRAQILRRALEERARVQAAAAAESQGEGPRTKVEMQAPGYVHKPEERAEAQAAAKPRSVNPSTKLKLPLSENIHDQEIPKEPVIQRGDKGSLTSLTSNFIRLDTLHGELHSYSVTFDPLIDNGIARRKCVNQHHDILGQVSTFHGNKLILPKKLSDDSYVLESLLEDGSSVKVNFSYNRKESFANPDGIIVINSILRKTLKLLGFVRVSKSDRNCYFQVDKKEILAKHKLEIWPGYVVTVDELEGGLLLTCDCRNKIVRCETVLQVMQSITMSNPLDPLNEMRKYFIGSLVVTKYNNNGYKIEDINFDMNPLTTFVNSNDKEVTFKDYYKNHYGIDIKDLRQPLLKTSFKRSEAPVPFTIMLVPELCIPVGLHESQIADYRIMKDIAQYTRLTPSKRQSVIETLLVSIQECPEAVVFLKHWGLAVPKLNVQLDARILTPTVMRFKNDSRETIGPRGEWSRSLSSKGLLKAMDMADWCLIYPAKESALAKKFQSELCKQGNSFGIMIKPANAVALPNDRIEEYLAEMRKTSDGTQMVVTLFPGPQRADRYAAVKKLMYCEKGKANQVVMTRTLSNEKRFSSVVQKIVLQINCKLGGELWGVRIPVDSFMIVGIDLYKDKSGNLGFVTALVASLNSTYSKFYSKCIFRRLGDKIEDNLASALSQAINAFADLNGGKKPSHILVYRDGIQSGDFGWIQMEGIAIHNKIKELYETGEPKFTYVAIQKKNNAKFFLINPKKEKEVDNPTAGTIVDHTVTLKSWYDFYLISMKVNIGTVAPVHYIVVFDNSNIEPNFIQKVSYLMTHMYFNWAGNVQVPAVCQYAHKLVELVGEHLHTSPCETMEKDLFYL